MKTILTYKGTGLETIVRTLRKYDAKTKVCTSAKDAFSDFDAVILLGGCDIAPALYGEKRTLAHASDTKRDRIEWILARRALNEQKPIFGICRGAQFLACVLGGSLYQDLGEKRHDAWHTIQANKKLLDHIPGRAVNSYHHQAIRRMPFGMQVAALAENKVIEAIYRPGYLGVQWHPELLIQNGAKEWESLFKWFAEDGLR